MRLSSRTLVGAGAAAALALSMAACGEQENTGQPGGGSTATASVDEALAAKVPAAIKSDGKLVVGTDASYAPNEFLDTDGKTVIGFDVDLLNAVAGKLGLKAEFTPSQFGDIIPGVQTGKYELGVSSFTINEERTAQALMVSYFDAGTQWATKTGNPAGVKLDDACGKKIAVQKDTVQVEDITARSAACTKAGKPAITIDQYQGQDQATAAVVSGKDDGMLADSPVCAYAVKQANGQLELLGEIYDSAPYGYVVAKEQAGLADALQAGLAAAIADGSYEAALKKWGVEAGAIANPAVNP